jgi:hypothetical protein
MQEESSFRDLENARSEIGGGVQRRGVLRLRSRSCCTCFAGVEVDQGRDFRRNAEDEKGCLGGSGLS